MISIKVNCNDSEKMIQVREKFHKALVGSPEYVDSSIAICDDDKDDTVFYLALGNLNENNIQIEVDSNDLEIINL